jgi:hypothetical protein
MADKSFENAPYSFSTRLLTGVSSHPADGASCINALGIQPQHKTNNPIADSDQHSIF